MIHWFWLWLISLGVITYFVIQRSVKGVTRTPLWLLWLVMMTPVMLWTVTALVVGKRQMIPVWMQFIPFLICPFIYWWLIQRGRIAPSNPDPSHPVNPQLQSTEQNPPDTKPRSEITLRPINKDEEAQLHTCFPWTVFYLQKLEYRPQAVICRGQLRAASDFAYATIQENVCSHFGDRFLVLLQEGLNGKPFFVLVPNPRKSELGKDTRSSLTRPGLAITLLGLTLVTTFLAGIEIGGTNLRNISGLPIYPTMVTGLSYSIPLLLILGIHELGHYILTQRYRVQATLPYFIPIPWLPYLLNLGTLGAFIKIRSPIPNRRALFDVGIAGPLAGLVITIPVLVWGLSHSTVTTLPPEVGLLHFSAINPHNSLMLFGFSKLILGNRLTTDSAINLHPSAIAAYLGLLMTALNLLPVGQLDGGHIVHAMFGQRVGALIGHVTRFLMLLLALFVQGDLFLWAIVLLFIPAVDEPALDDVTELDQRRDLLGLLTLAILLLIILPVPKIL